MWHKLMEIFGFRERHQSSQPSFSAGSRNSMNNEDVLSSATGTAPQLHVENQDATDKLTLTPKQTAVFNTGLDLPRKKTMETKNKECFGCMVTASVLSLGIILNVMRYSWKVRASLKPDVQKAVVVLNISLLGMWMAFMEKEWFKSKDTKVVKLTDKET